MPKRKAEQTYEVAGPQAVLGRSRGELLTSADFTNETQERRLLESGAIQIVTAPAAADKSETKEQ